MSEVRREHKDRKLLMGESQRKDGKYEYKYQDAHRKRKMVCSWRLTPSDRMPAGKRNDISLREKEKQIQKDLNSNVISDGGDYTVLELVEKYIRTKTGVRHNTKANYNFAIYAWIKMGNLWWCCTGKSTFSTFVRSTIKFTGYRCRLLRRTSVDIPFAVIWTSQE